jgi:hydrogenase maturation protease
MKLVIVGIGQELRGDDAAGALVVRRWAERNAGKLPADVKILPLPGLGLLDQLSGYGKAILVDAVLGGPGVSPGSFLFLKPDDLAAFTRGTGSAHGWGVAETLKLGEALGRDDLPAEINLLGIGGEQVEIAAGLSTSVEACIPAAVQALDRLVRKALA